MSGPNPETGAPGAPRPPRRLRFTAKISILIATVILLTAIVISSLVAVQLGDKIEGEVWVLLGKTLLAVTAILLAAVAFTSFFVRRLLQPVEELTDAARKVHGGDLSQRVTGETSDEIGELTGTFNEMVEGMSRRINLMHQLQDWTVRLSRKLHKDRIYNILAEMFATSMHSEAYRIYLYNEEKQALETCLESGAGSLPEPGQDTLAQQALRERWTQYLGSDDTLKSEAVDVKELAIPLLAGQNRIGVIRIGPSALGKAYNDETLSTLQTMAQQSAIAIDNANLYEQLAEKERIEQEMKLARNIQQSLLPRTVPKLKEYIIQGGSMPAFEVGGDYFDYIPSGNDHCHFVIGDVSGKGVPAAMIMSIVRALFHTYLEFEQSPQSILKRVNRNLSRDLEHGTFITLTALNLTPSRNRLTISRAGHEPVMIVGKAGEIRHLSPDGPALGLLDIESFDDLLREAEYDVQPDDTIILYTDGITEALNAEHEEFGIERLEAVIREHHTMSVKNLYIKILEEVSYFSSGVPQSDDRTLVILRRRREEEPAIPNPSPNTMRIGSSDRV